MVRHTLLALLALVLVVMVQSLPQDHTLARRDGPPPPPPKAHLERHPAGNGTAKAPGSNSIQPLANAPPKDTYRFFGSYLRGAIMCKSPPKTLAQYQSVCLGAAAFWCEGIDGCLQQKTTWCKNKGFFDNLGDYCNLMRRVGSL